LENLQINCDSAAEDLTPLFNIYDNMTKTGMAKHKIDKYNPDKTRVQKFDLLSQYSTMYRSSSNLNSSPE